MMETVNDPVEAPVPVSGTPEAVAFYIQQEWGFTPKEAAKAVSVLWLEQECNRVGIDIPSFPNSLPKLRLEDFSDHERKAQGMVTDSRIFLNLNKASAKLFAAVPDVVIDWLLTGEWKLPLLKSALMLLVKLRSDIQLVPEGLACVCMRAWKRVNGKVNIPFKAEDICPCHENPRDINSPLVCDLTAEDNRAHLGRASWECHCHNENNYCTLTLEKISGMLVDLEKRGILRSEDNSTYIFL